MPYIRYASKRRPKFYSRTKVRTTSKVSRPAYSKMGRLGRGKKYSNRGISRSPSTPFPRNFYTCLNYQDLIVLNITTGVLAQLTYNINDLYDPYAAIGGHQPRYFDTFIGPDNSGAPYKQFRVFGCRVSATFINTAATDDQAQVFLHWRDANGQQIADIIDMGEVPNMAQRTIGPANSAKGIVKLKKYISMKSMLGVKDIKDDENTLGSDAGQPADLVKLDLGAQPYALANAQYYVVLKLKFYCQFTNQTFPVAS